MFLFLLLKILCMPSRRSVENSDKPEELVEWNALIKQLFSPIACFNWHIFQSCSNQTCLHGFANFTLRIIGGVSGADVKENWFWLLMVDQWTANAMVNNNWPLLQKGRERLMRGVSGNTTASICIQSFLFRVFTLLHPFTFPSSSASASLSVFATYLFSFDSKESQYHQYQ